MEHVEHNVWRLFATRFKKKAESPDAQAQIQDQLDAKVAKLKAVGRDQSKLRRVVDDAAKLWSNRSNLRKRDVAYLAAALLYFISPLDAIPDLVPGVGYVDDVLVLSTIVGGILHSLSALGSRGKERLEDWIDERTVTVFERFDESATDGVSKTVAAVVIGLWGTTTAAAISLSVATVIGDFPAEWLAYVMLSAAVVVACNAVTAAHCWRAYQKLDGTWRQRLGKLASSKLTWSHLVALAAPIVVLIGLGISRALFVA